MSYTKAVKIIKLKFPIEIYVFNVVFSYIYVDGTKYYAYMSDKYKYKWHVQVYIWLNIVVDILKLILYVIKWGFCS